MEQAEALTKALVAFAKTAGGKLIIVIYDDILNIVSPGE